MINKAKKKKKKRKMKQAIAPNYRYVKESKINREDLIKRRLKKSSKKIYQLY
jgi:hypothetical protein